MAAPRRPTAREVRRAGLHQLRPPKDGVLRRAEDRYRSGDPVYDARTLAIIFFGTLGGRRMARGSFQSGAPVRTALGTHGRAQYGGASLLGRTHLTADPGTAGAAGREPRSARRSVESSSADAAAVAARG
jgi:hypothetical protein